MEPDARSGRVAVLAAALLERPAPGLDALAVLEAEGWGVLALPADDYPEAIAAPLLDQVAEHVAEFDRHGYTLVLIGRPPATLAGALEAYGVAPLAAIAPRTDDDLLTFLRTASGGRPQIDG